MAKAVCNGVTIIETGDIAHVEGNAYFPIGGIDPALLQKSETTPSTFCHWKGFASYFDLTIDGRVFEGAAWVYDEPYDEAELVRDRIAFWRDVEVTGVPSGRGLEENEPSARGNRSGWEALCWVMRSQRDVEGGVLDAAFIEANTDLEGAALRTAWAEKDVQRYASHYKWQLAGDPARLEKSE